MGNWHNLDAISSDKICSNDKRQVKISKCQAHQYEATRRWKSVFAKERESNTENFRDGFFNCRRHIPPWPEYLKNTKAEERKGILRSLKISVIIIPYSFSLVIASTFLYVF